MGCLEQPWWYTAKNGELVREVTSNASRICTFSSPPSTAVCVHCGGRRGAEQRPGLCVEHGHAGLKAGVSWRLSGRNEQDVIVFPPQRACDV